MAPPGAISTRRHHSTPTTPCVPPNASGTCDQKTNDQPNRSASVTYPVSSTNLANSAFVTAQAPILNDLSFCTRVGLSPSCGNSGSEHPIKPDPAGMTTDPLSLRAPLVSAGRTAGFLPSRLGPQQLLVSGITLASLTRIGADHTRPNCLVHRPVAYPDQMAGHQNF